MDNNQNMNQTNNPHTLFWMPWGAGGCLWRTLVFLLGICLISLLLSLLLKGGKDKPQNNESINPDRQDSLIIIGNDTVPNPYYNLPPELRDTSVVRDWNEPIPGVDELPPPERNFIPPIDSTSIITNPEDSLSEIVCNHLVVLFNSELEKLKADMTSFAQQFKQQYPRPEYSILYYNSSAGTMLVGVPQKELLNVANELQQKITGLDFIVTMDEIMNEESVVPSDSGFKVAKYDEYFKLIQAYDAWEITKGAKDVKVAIVDSYFDLSNPEIGERYVDRIHIPSKTVNVLPPNRMPTPNTLTAYCHGSHVAGLAIGKQNNQLGCSGIAPECTWIPVSLGENLSAFSILEGILYAVYHDADVINLSIGKMFPLGIGKVLPLEIQAEYSKTSQQRREQLWNCISKILSDHNCVLCTSAGNDSILMGMDAKNRPNNIIKVEAVDGKGIKAGFSNFGKVIEADLDYSTVAAPGVNLWSVSDKRCAPFWRAEGYVVSAKDGFQEMSGTSMASPIVTGAVALLKSKNKDLTAEQIIKILTMTGKQTDTQNRIGPTIQIRDALDATGKGDMLNFDDLMKDHNKLLGKWKSTYEIALVRSVTEEKLDDMWCYFVFTSTSSGRLEYHTVHTKRVYTAPISVKWGTNQLMIIQHRDAVSSDGKTVEKDDFVCRPNKNRLLETSCQRNGVERHTFLLEKVN